MEYELKEALNELKESVLNKTMNEVKAVQDHVDKLDIKLQTVNKTKGIMNEQTDELKSRLISSLKSHYKTLFRDTLKRQILLQLFQ